MRSPAAVLLVVLCVAASGQQRGGVTGGGKGSSGFLHGVAPSWINPVGPSFITSDLTFAQRLAATVSGSYFGLPAFWVSPGQGLFPGWNCRLRLGSSGFSRRSGWGWNGASAFMGSGFSPVPYPVLVGGPYGPDYSPQQLPPALATPPPQYIAEPAPPMKITEPNSGIQTLQPPVAMRETLGRESEPDGQENTSRTPSVHVYQAPAGKPTPHRDHPPLIALKNGWAFTVTKYWMKGKTLHFITPQGGHIQVPVMLVDHFYGQE